MSKAFGQIAMQCHFTHLFIVMYRRDCFSIHMTWICIRLCFDIHKFIEFLSLFLMPLKQSVLSFENSLWFVFYLLDIACLEMYVLVLFMNPSSCHEFWKKIQ